MLSVGLLGVFRIATVDSRTWSALGPSGRRLASFLFTFPGRPHRRERLADLFWPELDAEHARRALNSAIWRLRKLLAVQFESVERDNLQTLGSEITLQPARWLDIDAAALQEAAALAMRQPVSLDDPHKLDNIAAVLRRYEGPFLDGDDGDWVLEERERLHSLFLRTATLVVRRLGAAGRFDEVVGIARRALQCDPYREELVRCLLTLLVLDERRCEAIRYFSNWSKALKADLDIAPLPATRKLVDELRTLDAAEGLTTLQSRFIDRASVIGVLR
jgi:DNA-binding SARP family transcriptional activator